MLVLIVGMILHIAVGKITFRIDEWISLLTCSSQDTLIEQIVLYNRVPVLITALLSGMALSVSGMQLQTLFRNPVAGPYVLGISSGAAVVVALFLMGQSLLHYIQIPQGILDIGIAGAALSGSLLFSIIILYISKKITQNGTLLIIGLLLSGACSAFINLLESIADKNSLQQFVFWSFGSFQHLSYSQLTVLSCITLTGVVLALFTLQSMNLIQFGDDFALSNGIHLRRNKSFLIISSSILASGVTAFCGPIAFIGLAVPHFCRSILQTADHKKLFPAILICGAILTVYCSLFCSLPFFESQLPINVITSILGVPLLIYFIIKKPSNLVHHG